MLLVALVVGLFALATRSGDDSPGGRDRTAKGDTPSVLDGEVPSLEELTTDITVPPGPEEGLTVVDRGVSIVADRFDPARREGTFAAVIDNPHPDWIAQGVQVNIELLNEAGAIIGTDNAFVELVLPMQRVAVASLIFNAPTETVTNVNVTLDVAGWRQATVTGATFTTQDVLTEPAEFSGVRTTFLLRSSFPEALTDVGVTAVYRNAAGQIVGGYDTFVDLLEPDTDTPVEIALLANVPITDIASTELYPYATATPAE